MPRLPEILAHTQDAVTLNATKCFRGGKVFVQILQDNGVFLGLWWLFSADLFLTFLFKHQKKDV